MIKLNNSLVQPRIEIEDMKKKNKGTIKKLKKERDKEIKKLGKEYKKKHNKILKDFDEILEFEDVFSFRRENFYNRKDVIELLEQKEKSQKKNKGPVFFIGGRI